MPLQVPNYGVHLDFLVKLTTPQPSVNTTIVEDPMTVSPFKSHWVVYQLHKEQEVLFFLGISHSLVRQNICKASSYTVKEFFQNV
jgi:hypothetical protein